MTEFGILLPDVHPERLDFGQQPPEITARTLRLYESQVRTWREMASQR
jgi:hypothetical protein